MLKVLLYAYVSFISLASFAQPALPEWTGPAELVVEDPNKTVDELGSQLLDNGKLQLNWRVTGSLPSYFVIERSDNGKNFELMGILNKPSVQRFYQWSDDAPIRGRSFYRIRYSSDQGDTLYSRLLPVAIAGEITHKFYPNPVDHILIVRSDSPIDVQISDASGRVRISQLKVQGLTTINVSNLEKGIYLIRFSNKLTNVMSQEKLIKN